MFKRGILVFGKRAACLTGLAALGCGSAEKATPSGPPNFTVGTTHLIYHGINSFTIPPVKFAMADLTSGNSATISLSYSVESSAPDGGYAVALMKRVEDPAFLLLANCYLEHQAYEYLLTGSTEPHVHLCASVMSPRRSTRNPEFTPGSGREEVSLESLQWRDANKSFIRKVPGPLFGDAWVPLTSGSYSAWWQRVNDKFGVEALFNADQP
jgi:hypothetical protein